MRINIKIVVLIAAMLFVGIISNAQTIDIKKIIGLWYSDGTVSRLVFFKDINDNYQLVEWSSDSGEEMNISEIKVEGNTIKTTEVFVSTKYTTTNTYYLTDDNTLKRVIGGDTNTVLYFKR